MAFSLIIGCIGRSIALLGFDISRIEPGPSASASVALAGKQPKAERAPAAAMPVPRMLRRDRFVVLRESAMVNLLSRFAVVRARGEFQLPLGPIKC
jgi:hypothetical protein